MRHLPFETLSIQKIMSHHHPGQSPPPVSPGDFVPHPCRSGLTGRCGGRRADLSVDGVSDLSL